MTYEVNSSGRAGPVPGTELPEDEDPDRPAAHGLISLEDIRAPWGRLRELEDER